MTFGEGLGEHARRWAKKYRLGPDDLRAIARAQLRDRIRGPDKGDLAFLLFAPNQGDGETDCGWCAKEVGPRRAKLPRTAGRLLCSAKCVDAYIGAWNKMILIGGDLLDDSPGGFDGLDWLRSAT
jgi:hypothetical protein